MKRSNRYRITVEPCPGSDEDTTPPAPLTFTASSHDDLLAIMRRVQDERDGDRDAAAAFTLGLKLFGEAMLTDRDNPLFAEIRPHFGAFMRKLKSGNRDA
jgi:hypothetical protein